LFALRFRVADPDPHFSQNLGTLEAQNEIGDAHNGGVNAQNGGINAHNGGVEARNGAMEGVYCVCP
jgi:hypothetical protein